MVKPEVVAPGQYYAAPRRLVPPDGMSDRTGQYCLFNGTSAATPHAAGVAALLLEKKPTLTAAQFKALLREHLTKDGQTGTCPNPRWGFGKLDKAAVERMLRAVH